MFNAKKLISFAIGGLYSLLVAFGVSATRNQYITISLKSNSRGGDHTVEISRTDNNTVLDSVSIITYLRTNHEILDLIVDNDEYYNFISLWNKIGNFLPHYQEFCHHVSMVSRLRNDRQAFHDYINSAGFVARYHMGENLASQLRDSVLEEVNNVLQPYMN